ncbi:MAG: NADH peroxidase [Atopococcus tabaci]|uniref:NADH peroxidase n=1 Tax=Atopococcus tabaci TaxID=269774 RepID=A0AA43UCE2_9LACT|nr:NADH peroxidase [Atopococcus tabaci]
MKVIIVGTSHVGFEATQTLLKEVQNVDIHLFEQDDKMSFMG